MNIDESILPGEGDPDIEPQPGSPEPTFPNPAPPDSPNPYPVSDPMPGDPAPEPVSDPATEPQPGVPGDLPPRIF